MTSWWHSASTEARLAQVDGGIALGMTGRQIALASGLGEDRTNVVAVFASYHGRSTGGQGAANTRVRQGNVRQRAVTRDRSAYLRGERVNFFGSAPATDEFQLDEVEQ